MKILVTGAAGFIGFHISRRLLEDGHKVIGFVFTTDVDDQQLMTEITYHASKIGRA